MTKHNLDDSIYRVIDANINRLKEGIRVVEDIQRYMFNDADISKQLKNLRHLASSSSVKYDKLINARDVKNDVLKTTTKSESSRVNIQSILIANFKRIQESSRVLEEIFKLISIKDAEIFKTIRYKIYTLEPLILDL